MNASGNQGDSMSEEDFSDYLPIYLDETEEQLDDLVETMLALEEDPNDEASLQTAFRLLHSMKGASGMMGLDQITVLTHHLETRFERLRSGSLQLDRVTMNLTLRCIDFLKKCNGQVRRGETISTPEQLLEELHQLEEASERELETLAEVAGVSDIIAEITGSDPSESIEPSDQATRDELLQLESEGLEEEEPETTSEGSSNVFHLVIQFNRDDSAEQRDVQHAESFLEAIVRLGNVLATRPERMELNTEFEDQLDVILDCDLEPNALCSAVVALSQELQRVEICVPRDSNAPPLVIWQRASSPDESLTEKDDVVEKQEEVETRPLETPAGSQAAESKGSPQKQKPETTASQTARPTETMRVEIGRLDHLMNLAGELVVNRAQFAQVAEDLSAASTISRFRGNSDRVSRTRDFCDALEQALSAIRDGQTPDAQLHERLGEGLSWIRHQAELWETGRPGFNRLEEAIDQLARISDSLQRGVLGTRMVPIGPLLNRFKRVVRDLSLQFGKEVRLVIEGETTELDKRMIDALSDPITHLIRNSLDHGLESGDERQSAGKPECGTIVLSARHSGNQVSIVVRDDGRGISADGIRDSLVRKEVMSRGQADGLSDDDAIASIFHPGFSTAASVTDISGRGVGMDIVKATITELNGTIDIETSVGHGTTFTIQLPLTLAIIGSLLIRIGRVTFAVPKDDVREIVSVPRNKIVSVHGKRTFEVRGSYLPLIRITDVLAFHDPAACQDATASPETDKGEIEIAILQTGGQTIGLEVDQCVGSQDVVIKSLAENLTYLPGLAGASILGNGTVALMLDVASLPRLLNRNSTPAATSVPPSGETSNGNS